MNNRKYLRLILALAGLVFTAYFGFLAAKLLMNKPRESSLREHVSIAQAQEQDSGFEREISVWNNQFAQKSFFALVGLFVTLICLLPKKRYWIPKIVFSLGLVVLIIHHLLADGKISGIVEKGISLSVFWIVAAFIIKGTGMWCTIWRWKVLLEGQGFKIPLLHLIQSFLIGRFIGSFAPGTSGLDGYRAYDISRYTGKVARSLAVIFVEKLIGFFVLGALLLLAIPVGRALFSQKSVNTTSLVMMGLLFVGMMALSIVILFKPAFIRFIADRFVPIGSGARKKIDKAIKAVSAYENRKFYLLKALLIGFGVHLCTIGMYFCTARAIVEIGGQLFQIPSSANLFATGAMMIGATVLPLSIAGIGMREGVFAFFLGPVAAIYAFGGYLVGEIISLFGGPVWLARKNDYYEVIKAQRAEINEDVDDEDSATETEVVETPTSKNLLPSYTGYGLCGLGAGLLAGVGIGLVDAARLWIIGGTIDWTLPWYGTALYAPFIGILGLMTGLALALLGRAVGKTAASPSKLGTFIGFVLFGIFSFVIGFFYIQRDYFGEKAGLFSPVMLGALLLLMGTVVVFCVGASWLTRRTFSGRMDKHARFRTAAAFFVVLFAALFMAGALSPSKKEFTPLGPSPQKNLPNVILVMNDTHRPDYTGVYGGKNDLTPNLDAFARESVVYTNAFAQSSWTRPSVCSILTGRYASSHTAMMKGSVLPDEVTTLAESMTQGGYQSLGIATNYNLTPFFNVHQGFNKYHYLTPNLPFGATDEQSKLLFIEVAKKIEARFQGSSEYPEDYYTPGDVVTREALKLVDERTGSRPFFMFLSYMDVHDPYFRHPYDGYAISHRANPTPDPNDEKLIGEMKELYSGEIRFWDEQFGTLMDGLKERGLYEDTVIVVVSDHGEEFGEHGGFWHGTTLYDEQVKVIFMVKYPKTAFGIEGGVKISDWIRLIDVAPMILHIAGLPVPEEIQGSAKPTEARTPVFAEEDHQGNVLTSLRYVEKGQELKIIETNQGNPRGLKPQEFYDVGADPGESSDLVDSRKDSVETGSKALNGYKKLAEKSAAKATTKDLPDEQRDALIKLGYIKNDEK